MKQKAMSLVHAFLYLLLFISCISVSAFFALFFGHNGFSGIFAAVICVGVPYLIKRKRAEDLKAYFSIVSISRKDVAVIVFLALVVTLLVQCIQLLVPSYYLEQLPQHNLQYGALSVISTVITSPIAEEVYFRGFIQKGLSENFPPAIAVIITSFLFSGLHSGVVWGLMALIISVFYSILFLRYKSIFAPVIAHITSNCIAVAFNVIMAGSR